MVNSCKNCLFSVCFILCSGDLCNRSQIIFYIVNISQPMFYDFIRNQSMSLHCSCLSINSMFHSLHSIYHKINYLNNALLYH